MNLIKKRMPQHGGSEGVWEGVYIYQDIEGNELGRHKSRLTHTFPDDKPLEYHQRNQYFWDNGDTEDFRFHFVMNEDNDMAILPSRSTSCVFAVASELYELALIHISEPSTDNQFYAPFYFFH